MLGLTSIGKVLTNLERGINGPQYAPQHTAAMYGQPQPGYGYAAAPPPQFAGYQPGFQPQNPTAWALFQAVDRDRSGQVSINELHQALSNGGYTAFSRKTTRLLMKMFDNNPRDGMYGEHSYLFDPTAPSIRFPFHLSLTVQSLQAN